MRQPRPQGDPGQSPERHNGHLEAFPISLQIPFSSEEDKIKINWSWWCPQRDSKQLPDPSFVGLDIKNLTRISRSKMSKTLPLPLASGLGEGR